MMPVTIYGWKCLGKDERVLLERLNHYLARDRRMASKTKDRKMLVGYLPFVIRHFHWNLNQEMGTWFDIYPNEDLKGQFFFPDHKDCGWLIHVRIDFQRHANIIREESEAFVRGLLDSTKFEHRIIRESGDLFEGLPRGHIG